MVCFLSQPVHWPDRTTGLWCSTCGPSRPQQEYSPQHKGKAAATSVTKDGVTGALRMMAACLHCDHGPAEPYQVAESSYTPPEVVDEGQVKVGVKVKEADEADEGSEVMSAEKTDKMVFCLSLFITMSVHVLFLCLVA